ncbi:hypothetical protein Tco_0175174, partial [Tanacetum coccineum]
TVMSDSKDSTVTYTTVSSPFADLPDIGSPGVDGLPVIPEDPYAYVVDAFQSPPSPDYVPGPEYPPSLEFDLEPPLHAAALPTADLPGYVPESDLEEDPEEDDDEDPEEDPVDYPADGGDDGDESSNDDEDEDVDIEGDEEEEEHPAPADSTIVALPAVNQALSAEATDPFETDKSAATPPPHSAYRVTARISIRDETPILLPPMEEVKRLIVMPTPPSSPLSPWSSPLPQIPSPPLPLILSPLPVSPSPPQISSPTTHTISQSPVPVVIIHQHLQSYSFHWDSPSSGIPPLASISTVYSYNTAVEQDKHEVTLHSERGGSTASSDYRAIDSRPQEIGGDYRDAGGRP